MEEKKFSLEEAIVLLKAFHLDFVEGQYNKALLEWCNNWIDYNVKEKIDFETYMKNSKNILIKENKKAKDRDGAWEIQETYKGQPHGWIQWKGTDVCMDVHCKCGHHSHVDDDFAYFIKCPKCGTVFMCNGHIELIEVEQEPEGCIITPELGDE